MLVSLRSYVKCSVHRSFLSSVEVRSVLLSKLNTGTVAFFFGPSMYFSDWKSPLVLPLSACSCVSAARCCHHFSFIYLSLFLISRLMFRRLSICVLALWSSSSRISASLSSNQSLW